MVKPTKFFVAPLLLGVFCIGVLGCSNPVAEEPDYVPGELLVHLTETMPQQEATTLIDSYEIEFLEYFEYLGIVWVGVSEGEETLWKEKLEKDNLIRSASLVSNKVTLR